MSGAHAVQPKTRAMKHPLTCCLDECSRKYYAKGFCRLHWERNHANGDPLKVQILCGMSVAERLNHYSETLGDCVVFTGYRDKDGYGHMTIEKKDVGAHKAAYEEVHGPVPPALVVRHKCDNPPCINVAHLEIGTHRDNSNDKVERGRSAYGVKNAGARLSESQVLEVRAAIHEGVKQCDLARKYGVGQSTISRIKKGTHWRHLLNAGSEL